MSKGRTPIPAGQIKKKKIVKHSTYIKFDEIAIEDIINENTFHMHNSLLNNENRYMKITQKSNSPIGWGCRIH